MTAAAAQSLALRHTGDSPDDRQGDISSWKERLRQRSLEQLLENQMECFVSPDRPRVRDVFGFAVPTYLYLHGGIPGRPGDLRPGPGRPG